jgi:hypothetical protein
MLNKDSDPVVAPTNNISAAHSRQLVALIVLLLLSLSSGCHQPFAMAVLTILVEAQVNLVPDQFISDQAK